MRNKKKSGYIMIVAVITALAFISALVIGFSSLLWGNESKDIEVKKASSEVLNEKSVLQQNEEATVNQPSKTETSDVTVKYMTISQDGNVDVVVNYLNPVIGSSDFLVFEVSLGTHSIDLTEFKDIRKFVELRTDTGVVVTEGFEWDVENAGNHHITGTLKITNIIDDKPIIGQDTKSFKLVFKNIPDESEREHLYEGDKLK